jgi:hypothetical protein
MEKALAIFFVVMIALSLCGGRSTRSRRAVRTCVAGTAAKHAGRDSRL